MEVSVKLLMTSLVYVEFMGKMNCPVLTCQAMWVYSLWCSIPNIFQFKFSNFIYCWTIYRWKIPVRSEQNSHHFSAATARFTTLLGHTAFLVFSSSFPVFNQEYFFIWFPFFHHLITSPRIILINLIERLIK